MPPTSSSCPAGGTRLHAAHEAEPVVAWLQGLGYSAATLRYPLQTRHPGPLRALRDEVRRCREAGHPTVGVMGFSAGGHLAGHAAPAHGIPPDERPDFAVLGYPIVSMELDTYRSSQDILLGDQPPRSPASARRTPCTSSPTGLTASASPQEQATPRRGPRWRSDGSGSTPTPAPPRVDAQRPGPANRPPGRPVGSVARTQRPGPGASPTERVEERAPCEPRRCAAAPTSWPSSRPGSTRRRPGSTRRSSSRAPRARGRPGCCVRPSPWPSGAGCGSGRPRRAIRWVTWAPCWPPCSTDPGPPWTRPGSPHCTISPSSGTGCSRTWPRSWSAPRWTRRSWCASTTCSGPTRRRWRRCGACPSAWPGCRSCGSRPTATARSARR